MSKNKINLQNSVVFPHTNNGENKHIHSSIKNNETSIYKLKQGNKRHIHKNYKTLLKGIKEHTSCVYGLEDLRLFTCAHYTSQSVQSLSHFWLWPHGLQHTRLLSITNSQSLLKLMSIDLVVPCNHLILCRPILLLLSIFPSIRVFSNESALHIKWEKYWSFSFRISPTNEYSGLIPFSIGWLDFLAVQESSPTPQFKSTNSSVLSFLYSLTLTSIHNHWKNHSLD